tara:strand:- start:92 stop:658 length:567 start_codon:yes stop_codon:yes gene_type:complete
VLGTSDVPLTDLGKTQAEAAARRAAMFRPKAVYCSPYFRAVESANYLQILTGLSPIRIAGLREMNSGDMEGIKASQMEELYPEYMAQWRSDATTTRPPGGETLGEVHNRAWKAFLKIAEECDNEHVIVVAHLFPIQGIICRTLGLNSNQYNRIRVDLGSLSSVQVKGKSGIVLGVNDTSHLNSGHNSF